jgi:hypothetical protein
MRRNLALTLVLTGAVALAGCGETADNTSGANANNSNAAGNPPREGVVETNANIPANSNSKTVSSNTAVLTNDNGNANTSGVRSTNSNANDNRNSNSNRRP